MKKTTQAIKRLAFTDQSGQAFIEFILLLLVMFVFSRIMLIGVNSSIGDLWVSIVSAVAQTPVVLR